MITENEMLEKLKISYSSTLEKMKELTTNSTEYLRAKEELGHIAHEIKKIRLVQRRNRLKLDKIEGLLEKCVLGIEPEEPEKSHKM